LAYSILATFSNPQKGRIARMIEANAELKVAKTQECVQKLLSFVPSTSTSLSSFYLIQISNPS